VFDGFSPLTLGETELSRHFEIVWKESVRRPLFRLSPWQGERTEVRGWSFTDAPKLRSNPHPPLSL